MFLLELLGLAPSERDRELKKLVSKSYTSVHVVGRGTVRIDPSEVRATRQFKKAQEEAEAIVSAE